MLSVRRKNAKQKFAPVQFNLLDYIRNTDTKRVCSKMFLPGSMHEIFLS